MFNTSQFSVLLRHHTSVLLSLSIMVFLVSCGTPEERKEKYMVRAQNYLEEKNLPKARVALRNVLKIDPKDSNARFLLGQVEEKEKNWRNAYSHYLQVIEIDPTHREALIKLGKIYLQGGLPDDTLKMVDSILSNYPEDPIAHTLKAAVTAQKGDISQAISYTETIFQQHPSEADPAILLSALYTSQNRLSDAESILRQSLGHNSHNIEILSTLATTLIRNGKLDEAERIFIQIVNSEPILFDHRIRLALFYDHAQNQPQAYKTFKEAVSIDPTQEDRWLVLAEYVASRFGTSQAEATLQEATQTLPDSIKLKFALGKLYEVSNQLARAKTLYSTVAEEYHKKPAGLDAKVKLARLDFSEGNDESGAKQLEEVLEENPRSTAGLLLKGNLALKKGDAREAVLAFRTALKDQPNLARGYALLGKAFLLHGEPHLARESLEKAVALNPQRFEAQRALATLEFGQGQSNRAKTRLESIVRQAPQDVKSLSMLLNLLAYEEDWDVAATTLAQLRNIGLDSFDTEMAEGKLHQARQAWDKAERAFLRAQKIRPNNPAPLLALIQSDLQQGQSRKAKQRLQSVLIDEPHHPYAYGLMGELLLRDKQYSEADKAFQQATKSNPQWVASWLNHAKVYFSQQKMKEGIAVLHRGIERNPTSEELRFILAEKLAEVGVFSEAIQQYEGILQFNPKSIVAANNLASLLTDHQGDPASLQRALTLTKDFEQVAPHPFFLDTLGWVNVQLGKYQDGLRIMKKAVEKAPHNPLLNYHMGVAYHLTGHSVEGRSYLKKALQAKQTFPGMDKAKELLQQLEENTKSVETSQI